MEINVARDGKMLVVKSPYSAVFVKEAKDFDGRWEKERAVWTFSTDVEEHVWTNGTTTGGPCKS